jgi:hypothetical protein
MRKIVRAMGRAMTWSGWAYAAPWPFTPPFVPPMHPRWRNYGRDVTTSGPR